MQVQSLTQEDPFQKEMATHSSIPAWAITWTEEPSRLQYMGWQKVRPDLAIKQQQQYNKLEGKELGIITDTYSKKVLVTQSCLTLATWWTQAPLSMGFSRQDTGVGCHFLLQGIFPIQGSNLGLPHCRQILYCLSHQGRNKKYTLIHIKKIKLRDFPGSLLVKTPHALPKQRCVFHPRLGNKDPSFLVAKMQKHKTEAFL